MSKKVIFVTATRAQTSEEFTKRPLYKFLEFITYHDADTDFVISHDCTSLPKLYNRFIIPEFKNTIVVFLHDDVEIEDYNICNKLRSSPYTVTGLAGAKSFNKDAENLAWHLAAPRQDYVGEVAHTQDGRVWTTVFGPTNSRSLTLDGLFLAVNIGEVVNKVTFDEDFNFHFYDTSFCLRLAQQKISAGVLPIRVVHHSIGDSMLSDAFKTNQEIFRKKYCNAH